MYKYLFISAAISFIAALCIRKLALRFGIKDAPDAGRKLHKKTAPLLGGLAPFVSFFGCVFYLFRAEILPQSFFAPVMGLFLGGFIIMVGGFLDDKYIFSPARQIIFPLLAIVTVLFFGVRIKMITSPLGGIFYLGILPSAVLSFAWLLTISYSTKILDGLDGLVSGVTAMGALTIFLFTTLTDFKEPGIPYVALALAGSFIGFLFLNKYPARIFLGEGGSLFSGFILGSLAIMTGAKIAVTLMVLALPLIDLAAVIIKRLMKKKSIFSGDRLHLHYLLVDRGWKPQNVVYLFWGLSAFLGLASVFLPSIWKITSLVSVSVIFFAADLFLFKEK